MCVMIISVHVVSTSFFDWSDHYHNIILIDAQQVSHPAVLQCFRRKTKKFSVMCLWSEQKCHVFIRIDGKIT